MCVMAIAAVASIGQAVAGFAAASQQADEQNAYHEQNRRNAIAAASDRYRAIGNKANQERNAASHKLFEKRVEALKKKATALTSAGEGGVTGLSVASLAQDFIAQEARSEAAITTNFDYTLQSLNDEADATFHQTKGRIDSVRKASSPSPLPFILQGIGGAAGAFKRA